MPNLAQCYALANAKSSYSRPDEEIYAALNKGGFRVYTAVLKEFAGFFLKFDTTSVSLTPGIAEYALPPDLSQLVHIAETLSLANSYRPITPESIGDALEQAKQGVGWDDLYSDSYGGASEFSFAGPYLDAASTISTQVQKIRISPIPMDMRFVELAYTAKWLPVVDGTSKIMLPEEGTHAMLDYAIAELLRSNNDSLSSEYAAEAKAGETAFLTWVRNRQIQQWPQITPYLG